MTALRSDEQKEYRNRRIERDRGLEVRLVADLAARLCGLLRRGREDDETAEELRFHLEMEAAKNLRAGMSPNEAHRQARLRLGGVEAIREAVRDARGTRPLEDLVRDLGYALRGARRNPGFTLAAIVSLAIPIGFNTALFTVVDSVLFRPLPLTQPAQVVDVYSSDPDDRHTTSSYPDYLDLRAENDVFTEMAAHSPMLAVMRVDEDVDLAMGETVTGNYFPFLGVRPVLGRLLAPEDDRPGAARVAVISSGLWTRAFGRDPAVVGRMLSIRSQPYLVVGVAPPEFFGMPPIPGPDLWTPVTWVDDVTPIGISTFVSSPGETRLERRGQRWMFIKGRLRDDVTLAQAEASLDVLMANLAARYPESNEDRQVSLTLTDDVRLPPPVAGPVRIGAAGLMLVVGVVLLVACANVMGMLLARGVARRREIGVRLAIGAGRGRLVRQLLTESLVLSSFGAVAGLTLAWSLLRVLAAVESPIGPIPITLEFALDARAFLFTAALATAAGAVAGIVPALSSTQPNLVRDLNGAVAVARAGGRRWLLRNALVAGQLAATVPLLVLAGLLARSAMGTTAGVSLGFEPDRIAAVGTDLNVIGYERERADRFVRTALERIQSMPGVEAAALSSRAPLDLSFSPQNVLVPGLHGPADRGTPVDTAGVSADYFDTLGVLLLQGRTFTAADTPESPRVAVVSKAMARRFWPAGTAIGRRFRLAEWDGLEYEVVGVSADYKVRFPAEDPAPYLHLAASQRLRTGAVLLARTRGDAAALSADIRRELRRMEPDLFFFLQGDTLRETADVTMLPFRIGASVASASGAVALMLGAIGLYGVIAYLVAGRTREFAIRAALGARSGTLLRLVLATGAWVVAVGIGAGAGLALLATRVVAQAANGIAPADPLVWASVLLLLVAVCMAAFAGPARRMFRLDLPRALRVD